MSITGAVFLLVFFAALGLALFRNPLYGLYAYVGEFYLHPPSRWWGVQLPDMRWSMLAAIVTIMAIWIRAPADRRPVWFKTVPARIMLLFVVWFWIGSLWALDTVQHVPEAIKLSKYLLVFYMIYRLIDTPAKGIHFLIAHVIGCFYLGFLGYQAGSGDRLDGVGGPGIDDSNTLGMQLATAVVIGGVLALHVRKYVLAAVVLAVAFALNGIVLTGSRGAFLALLAGGVAVVPVKPAEYARKFYLLAAVGLLAIGMVASQQFWERMNTVQAIAGTSPQEIDVSAESRIVMAAAQLQMAARHPFGAGHRGSEYLSGQYLDPIYLTASGQRSSHNVFLTVLVEQGIPGVILSWLLIWWVIAATRSTRRLAQQAADTAGQVCVAAILGALSVVLVAGLFADFAHCEVQMWMFGLLAGLQTHYQATGGAPAQPAPARNGRLRRAAHARVAGLPS